MQKGAVYYVSKGTLKPAQKTYNHLKSDWEITLDGGSTIEPAGEDTSIQSLQFDFHPIADVENMEANAVVDVMGVVVGMSATQSIMRKNGTETHKRTVMLRDESGRQVELTMWGEFCSGEGDQLQVRRRGRSGGGGGGGGGMGERIFTDYGRVSGRWVESRWSCPCKVGTSSWWRGRGEGGAGIALVIMV